MRNKRRYKGEGSAHCLIRAYHRGRFSHRIVFTVGLERLPHPVRQFLAPQDMHLIPTDTNHIHLNLSSVLSIRFFLK